MPFTAPKNSQEELDSFTKKIIERCGAEHVVVAVCKPPSYLMYFFETYCKDIIIIHKRNASGDTSFEDITYYATEGDKEGSSLDVTGNPLENHFNDISIMNESSSYTLNNNVKITPMPPGLDMVKVRTAINIYSMMMPENSLPLWVVCDGSETKNGGAVRLMCRMKRDGHIVEGWAVDTGSKESVPDPKMYIVDGSKYKDPSKCSIKSRRKIPENTQDGYCAFIALSWTELVFYPPTTSMSLNISLSAEYKTGSNEGPLRFIWEQLLLINAFWKSFESDGSSSLQKLPASERVLSQLPNSVTAPSIRLVDILQEPIRQAKKPSEFPFLSHFISEVSSPTYCDLDVLGKLWYLFLECSTTTELKRCLEMLQQEVKSKQMGTLMFQSISSTSLTQVTDLISPLKHLIEFGVLKLHRELTSILSKNKLAFNIKSLPKFTRLPLPEWRETVASSIRWLAQSFCLLELVCYTQEALNIRNEDLYSLAFDFHRQLSSNNDVTKDVEWYINNPIQHFTITLMPEHLKKNVEGFPEEWLMTVNSSKTPNYVVESKYFNGTVRPFVPPKPDKIASNTLSVTMNMNDTTVNQVAVPEVSLWSAELHMIHHKIGKNCFPIRKVK